MKKESNNLLIVNTIACQFIKGHMSHEAPTLEHLDFLWVDNLKFKAGIIYVPRNKKVLVIGISFTLSYDPHKITFTLHILHLYILIRKVKLF